MSRFRCVAQGAAALALILGAAQAQAQGFPNTQTMTCAQATALVQQSGKIELSTSANAFNLYVKDESFCRQDQQTKPSWAPTSDNPQCFIGYICQDPTNEGGGG